MHSGWRRLPHLMYAVGQCGSCDFHADLLGRCQCTRVTIVTDVHRIRDQSWSTHHLRRIEAIQGIVTWLTT